MRGVLDWGGGGGGLLERREGGVTGVLEFGEEWSVGKGWSEGSVGAS